MPVQYKNFSDVKDTNQASKIANIFAEPLETKVEILLAFPSNSKMIFSDEHTPVRKVLLQDEKISVEMQEKFDTLIHAFKDIMS